MKKLSFMSPQATKKRAPCVRKKIHTNRTAPLLVSRYSPGPMMVEYQDAKKAPHPCLCSIKVMYFPSLSSSCTNTNDSGRSREHLEEIRLLFLAPRTQDTIDVFAVNHGALARTLGFRFKLRAQFVHVGFAVLHFL